MTRISSYSIKIAAVLTLLGTFPAVGQGTLFVEGSNVGVGVQIPEVHLHVFENSDVDTTMFRLENDGGNRFDFVNHVPTHGGWWQFVNTSNPNGADLVIRELTKNSSEEFRLTETGNLTISGTLFQNSSREVKSSIEVVDPAVILRRVLDLSIVGWSYKTEAPEIRHIGPMAEDFFAHFGLGGTDSHISTIDTSGVALAAIQGLHDELEERDRRIEELMKRQQRLQASKDDLEDRLRQLEQAVRELR